MDNSILRKTFIKRASLGSAALTSLLNESSIGSIRNKVAPKCKRVIVLCMAGGPSHLETFDFKPKLKELHGQPMPKSFTEGQQIAQLQGQAKDLKVLGPQHDFSKHGKSGQEISAALPNIAKHIADEICIIKSMQTEQINHDPAHTFMNTGSIISGRPSMGS